MNPSIVRWGDTAVSTFNFRGFDLRCVEIEGEPWFLVKDVCDLLGLKPAPSNGSYQTHYRKLDASQMQKVKVPFPKYRKLRERVTVSESGLYKLIMRSDKPEAKAFQEWVTRDVLPAIRKDGGYIEGEEDVVSGQMSEDYQRFFCVCARQGVWWRDNNFRHLDAVCVTTCHQTQKSVFFVQN